MKEHRIYLDDKIINVCYNEYTLMCNYTSYKAKYGDRITTRMVDSNEDIEEKQRYLATL